jgi:carbon storage regulator CsrA
MLILTRKRDGVIHVGQDIVIRVIQTGKGSVKLGIEAPGHVQILRGELKSALEHFDVKSLIGEHADQTAALLQN